MAQSTESMSNRYRIRGLFQLGLLVVLLTSGVLVPEKDWISWSFTTAIFVDGGNRGNCLPSATGSIKVNVSKGLHSKKKVCEIPKFAD